MTGARQTARLDLIPIGPEHADDLCTLYQDPVVAAWNAGTWSSAEAEAYAARCADQWRLDGISKWIAYHRSDGALIGRGGMTRMPAGGAATRQIEALVGGSGWERGRLELGWALLSPFHRQGYATEIGQEALNVANKVLGARAVISFTERHNVASRRVAERLAMALAGEIRTEGLIEGTDHVADDAPFAVYISRPHLAD